MTKSFNSIFGNVRPIEKLQSDDLLMKDSSAGQPQLLSNGKEICAYLFYFRSIQLWILAMF